MPGHREQRGRTICESVLACSASHVARFTFNCPQRLQCHVLSFGKADDSGDFHPFVGFVGTERYEAFAGLYISRSDSLILAAAWPVCRWHHHPLKTPLQKGKPTTDYTD